MPKVQKIAKSGYTGCKVKIVQFNLMKRGEGKEEAKETKLIFDRSEMLNKEKKYSSGETLTICPDTFSPNLDLSGLSEKYVIKPL